MIKQNTAQTTLNDVFIWHFRIQSWLFGINLLTRSEETNQYMAVVSRYGRSCILATEASHATLVKRTYRLGVPRHQGNQQIMLS